MLRSVRMSASNARLGRLVSVAVLAVACAALIAPAPALAAYRQTYHVTSKWNFPVPLPSAGFQSYGMALTSGGDVLVGGHDDYAAQYTSVGGFVKTFGQGLGTLSRVDNVAARGADIWAADAYAGVFKFDADGNSVGEPITAVPAVSSFDTPLGLAIDASGCVYVSDRGGTGSDGFRISKFTSDGAFVTRFGESGTGMLWSAQSIAIGAHFEVYVADWQHGQVNIYKPSNSTRTAYTYVAKRTSTRFEEPWAVATDIAGNVFVIDNTRCFVTKLDPSGEALASWGSAGVPPLAIGTFQYAWSAAVAPNGHVFIDDRDDFAVQEFVSTDVRPLTWASANLSVTKGRKVSFKYKASSDASPYVKVTIKVYKGSVLKSTISCGTVGQGVWNTKSWTCKLARGKYTWKVYATDSASHKQRSVAYRTLTVR